MTDYKLEIEEIRGILLNCVAMHNNNGEFDEADFIYIDKKTAQLTHLINKARLDDLWFCLDRINGEDSYDDMREAISDRIKELEGR